MLTNEQVLELLTDCSNIKFSFSHTVQLEVAWRLIRLFGFKIGCENTEKAFLNCGHILFRGRVYNKTITFFWFHMLNEALKETPEIEDFEVFITHHKHLGNHGLQYNYYSAELIHSDNAYTEFLKPDLKPLPEN